MMNPFKDVNWNPGLAEKRTFALSLIIGFPAIAAILSLATWLIKHSWKPFPLWLGIIGLAVGIVLWLLPRIARPFYVVWYFVACCMGIVVGNVVFGLFFYLVFTSFGLLRRAFSRDAFPKGFDKSKPSYWQPAEKAVDLKRYYRQF
jgi:hypothetical protein